MRQEYRHNQSLNSAWGWAPDRFLRLHDARSVRMLECVAKGPACNPVDFVPEERNQISRLTFQPDTKIGRILADLTGNEFFTDQADRPLVTSVEERNP